MMINLDLTGLRSQILDNTKELMGATLLVDPSHFDKFRVVVRRDGGRYRAMVVDHAGGGKYSQAISVVRVQGPTAGDWLKALEKLLEYTMERLDDDDMINDWEYYETSDIHHQEFVRGCDGEGYAQHL